MRPSLGVTPCASRVAIVFRSYSGSIFGSPLSSSTTVGTSCFLAISSAPTLGLLLITTFTRPLVMYFPSTASKIDSRLEPRPETRTPIGTKLSPCSGSAASKICGLLATRIRCDVKGYHSDRRESKKLPRISFEYRAVPPSRSSLVCLDSRLDSWFPARWESLQSPPSRAQLRHDDASCLEIVDEPTEIED